MSNHTILDPWSFDRTTENHRNIFEKLWNEVCILYEAWTWRFVQSIVGPLSTVLIRPSDEWSEWGAIWKWGRHLEIIKLIKVFVITILAVIFPPIGLVLFLGINSRSKGIVSVGEQYQQEERDQPEERRARDALWLEVNGVSTNHDLQYANGQQLSHLFKTKISLLYNPSQGMLVDLVECFRGRTMNWFTPICKRVASELRKQLMMKENIEKKRKIILIGHSQGTIIVSNALEILMRENDRGVMEQFDRLEVYTFGCASTEFFQVEHPIHKTPVPFYEHFANKGDYVANIGILHRVKKWKKQQKDSSGKKEEEEKVEKLANGLLKVKDESVFMPGRWWVANVEGHLLGEHYLPRLRNNEYHCINDPSATAPHLLSYLPPSVRSNA